jgi:Origin recognition complex winged helix C-terminal
MQNALLNPHHYLQCNCCDGSMQSNLPDISIMHKLYLEFGRWISLVDWFNAFVSVLGHDPTSTEFDECYRTIVSARFVQCVSELFFFGFLKLSSKKKDYALRLTFDSHVVDF